MRHPGRPVMTVLFLAAYAMACKGEKGSPAGPSAPGPSGAGSSGAAASGVQASRAGGGTSSAPATMARVPSRCPANQPVTGGDLAEIGGALYRAYQAALKGNTPEAFEEFQAAFQPEVDRNHLKAQIFPRVVEHVGKYVAGSSDPSFTLCRVEKQTPDRVKVFVWSRDPKKSDPPSLLVLRDGKWLIDSMTP